VLDWLRRIRSRTASPLRGAPATPRHKTYSADSGYVYTYYYEGYRESGEDLEFVFQMSTSSEPFTPVFVSLTRQALETWESSHRELTPTERYAIAKLALFQAFDDRPEPTAMRRPVLVRPADAEAILERLEID
jgi:hypothetical protein